MNRRHFLHTTAALAAASATVPAAEDTTCIDVNFSIGAWPFRTLQPLDADAIRQRGITQAITGSLDALLQRDIAVVNARLAAACAKSGGALLPAGCIHPRLPAWRDDVKRCAEQHGMKVVRVLPNYHGYTLADAVFAELLDAVTTAGLALQIVAQCEDQRTQHPLVQIAPVDLKPLPDLLLTRPQARVMVLNANAAMITTALRGCTTLWLDCAMIESVGGIENTLKSWPADKLCLGTHAPVFYPESSMLKLQESELSAAQLAAITRDNARTFLA
ncbi:MAG: twin-arginine translocation signal domain-containing protein [Verrucomicrobiaceae bacterium]|nr:twin-arginine translocation signal domain-containing protein [Verrucomicrobiaceae bacterium]